MFLLRVGKIVTAFFYACTATGHLLILIPIEAGIPEINTESLDTGIKRRFFIQCIWEENDGGHTE